MTDRMRDYELAANHFRNISAELAADLQTRPHAHDIHAALIAVEEVLVSEGRIVEAARAAWQGGPRTVERLPTREHFINGTEEARND